MKDDDSERFLLSEVERMLNQHGGDLDGATHLDGEVLSIFDGRVRLRAQVDPADRERSPLMAHAHLIAELAEEQDERLDACLVGIGKDVESALREIAQIWLTSVAGLIRSLLEGRAVCTASAIRPGIDRGFEGVDGYIGPCNFRFKADEDTLQELVEQQYFRHAVAAASPRRLHLAKATIQAKGPKGFARHLELDGHEASLVDTPWATQVSAPENLLINRFAVFRFPEGSPVPDRRRQLERAIRFFALNYSRYETIEDLLAAMAEAGIDSELVHEVESCSTLAFGRYYFSNRGVQYPTTVFRARRGGKIEEVPLMSLPAFNRAYALAKEIQEQLSREHFQDLCCYSAESNVLLKAIENGAQDFSNMALAPCVVPDRGVDDATFESALAMMSERLGSSKPKKPWWKFW